MKNMMKKEKSLTKVIFKSMAGMIFAFCAVLFSAVPVFAEAFDNGMVQAEGYGAIPLNVVNFAQGKAMARRAAIVDAYRNLAEYIEGVQVDSSTKVVDMMVANDLIKTRVSAVIKQAKIIAEEYTPEDGYKVLMSVPVFGETNSLAGAVLPENLTPEAFPAPVFSAAQTGKPENRAGAAINSVGGYTGVIIDCQGLSLQTAMSPVIKTESGTPVYGYKNLDHKFVIRHGMAAYSHGDENLARAGAKPLVIKAVAIDGFCNPMISSLDADRLLTENHISHFLDRCAVVFMRD